jgi:hypothetical protein
MILIHGGRSGYRGCVNFCEAFSVSDSSASGECVKLTCPSCHTCSHVTLLSGLPAVGVSSLRLRAVVDHSLGAHSLQKTCQISCPILCAQNYRNIPFGEGQPNCSVLVNSTADNARCCPTGQRCTFQKYTAMTLRHMSGVGATGMAPMRRISERISSGDEFCHPSLLLGNNVRKRWARRHENRCADLIGAQ